METRLLKYALEIARQGSFTRAASNLRIAQPSLSQQIAKFEHELGTTLFHRGHGSVRPTPDGRRFLERAEFIVKLHEDLEREMIERSAGIGSELTIGTPAITGEHILPALLEEFKIRYPKVHVRMIEDSPRALEELTAKGDTDISLLPLPIEDSRLSTRSILTEPILLAVPPDMTKWMNDWNCTSSIVQSSGRRISLSALRLAPFIVLKSGYGFRHTVLELCAESGFQPEIGYETSSIEMAQSLVAHGLGVTLIPAMVKRHRREKSPLYFELDENPVRTLSFIYRKDRYLSMASRAFIDMSVEVIHILFPDMTAPSQAPGA